MVDLVGGKDKRSWAVGLGVCALGAGLSACGRSTSLTTTETLTVAMYGAFQAPPDATGNSEPRSETYTLTGVSVLGSDGTPTSVMTETEPTTLKIVNRPQIIEQASLHDFVGKTLTGVRVSFDASVTGEGKYEAAMPFTLTTTDLDLLQAISVATASTVRLNIKVEWKNTVTRDDSATPPGETMTAPAFGLEIGNE